MTASAPSLRRRVLVAEPSCDLELVRAELAGLDVEIEASAELAGDDVIGVVVGVEQPVREHCTDEVAHSTLALLLALLRGVVELDRSVRAGSWDYAAAGAQRRVSDVRLGLVGFGRIARAVARRARGLGMEVAAYDPLVPPNEIRAAGATPLRLGELLASCEAVSIHAPLTLETAGMIGAREIAAMKPGAVLVNVARAEIVDQEALLRALADGHLAGAALDVLEVEPPTADDPAPQAPNLIVTPHAAWYSRESEREATVRAARAVAAVLGAATTTPSREVEAV